MHVIMFRQVGFLDFGHKFLDGDRTGVILNIVPFVEFLIEFGLLSLKNFSDKRPEMMWLKPFGFVRIRKNSGICGQWLHLFRM
jgi:hypothetical protein